MLKRTKTKANEIWTASTELYEVGRTTEPTAGFEPATC